MVPMYEYFELFVIISQRKNSTFKIFTPSVGDTGISIVDGSLIIQSSQKGFSFFKQITLPCIVSELQTVPHNIPSNSLKSLLRWGYWNQHSRVVDGSSHYSISQKGCTSHFFK
jgi:hypothetical protein